MTFDLEVTTEVANALHRIANEVQPKHPLTREECTTPELRLEYIAQWLEAGGEAREGIFGFSMRDWHKESMCGMTCCIGGSTNVWFGGDIGKQYPANSERAARLLGMDNTTAKTLFYPTPGSGGSIIASPAHAARCIRKYQREGVVDWEGTR